MINNLYKWPNNQDSLERVHSCNCVGPQNGQPLCPCAMRSVKVVDGEYVRIEKLGKVRIVEDAS